MNQSLFPRVWNGWYQDVSEDSKAFLLRHTQTKSSEGNTFFCYQDVTIGQIVPQYCRCRKRCPRYASVQSECFVHCYFGTVSQLQLWFPRHHLVTGFVFERGPRTRRWLHPDFFVFLCHSRNRRRTPEDRLRIFPGIVLGDTEWGYLTKSTHRLWLDLLDVVPRNNRDNRHPAHPLQQELLATGPPRMPSHVERRCFSLVRNFRWERFW